ncbi:hypothetical protein GWK47_052006 [Chionoecetes opilio]|uniref:Uncharacterized protein n=1 Tax=Chionoecetes opilio TaxID=41210 RepID=A0A8J5CSY0_CHIOP|nr:hypothetical protein GWK47_052006 [Chionoecetes opilio]
MTSSEAELMSKQEQLKTITEQLQSCGPVAAPQLPDTSTQQVAKLEEKIRELELERNNLKKAVKLLESDGSGGREGGCGGQDAQSEVLSTSTISRADDSQRMKELEDTFEERYMRVTLQPSLTPLTPLLSNVNLSLLSLAMSISHSSP